MLQWFSAKENLTKQTKLSGFSLQQVSSIVGQLLKLDKRLTNLAKSKRVILVLHL